MKKILFLSLVFFSLAMNAQVFTSKSVRNKFEETISSVKVRTRIEWRDSILIIEEKGHAPVKYKIVWKLGDCSDGDENHIVKIMDNIYGYEKSWTVCLIKDYPAYIAEQNAFTKAGDMTKFDAFYDSVDKRYYYHITNRVVVNQYTGQFEVEFFWISKGKSSNRTIYTRK